MSDEHKLELGLMGLCIVAWTLLALSEWYEHKRPDAPLSRLIALHQPFWLTAIEWFVLFPFLRAFVFTAHGWRGSVPALLVAAAVVAVSMVLWTRRESREPAASPQEQT